MITFLPRMIEAHVAHLEQLCIFHEAEAVAKEATTGGWKDLIILSIIAQELLESILAMFICQLRVYFIFPC